MSSFQQKIKKYANKQECGTHTGRKNQSIETVPEKDQMLN